MQNVHHAGEPMPGEEQEDIVMTSTQSNILNISCPLSGKPITELAEPVRRYQILQIYPSFLFFRFCSLDCYFPRCNHFGWQLYFNWKKCVLKYHLKGHMLFMQVLEYDGIYTSLDWQVGLHFAHYMNEIIYVSVNWWG